ncbi:ATP-binding protein [Pseudonocardia hydrocarbonoxydans]|uniref:Cell division control protein 48 CDC48 n=1 Tax=Pseudonocardia hydrocarbonoxydans TaxID=76726 RepID=A0A4Y3WUY6_9PSEU|nr:AAA family ATPase [Pseudonocardia hydrocarbonoxydans]GEC21559.1 cell division control protein 48 CDC48 [Pseudonocardia hydrocarbonoxydans]
MPDDALLGSLLAAVDASPDDVPLRLHVADLLAARDRLPEALAHCTQALSRAPGDPRAVALLQRLTAAIARPVEPGFDWGRAEQELGPLEAGFAQEYRPDAVTEDVERPSLTLADVGGMEQVKQRLEMTLLGPMRNPELARAFGTSTAGGLLLYGPPGCGKTFVARAVAGELGASFYEVGISDVLDMYTGSSERNLTQVFEAARRNAPCVLFFDEVDALGQKRSHLTHSSSMRNTVNTLLAELDAGRNEGVFVLGATNHPWDVDSALRRPGRFDRMLLVLPPDAPARAAILRHHLRDRPVSGIDLDRLTRSTEHFSGADLAHLCTTAVERALADSVRLGSVRPVGMADLDAALAEVRPSTGPWFATARNVVAFANTDGSYDDLAAYLKQNRKL